MSLRKLSDMLNVCFCIFAVIFLFLYPKSCIEAAKDGVSTALYIVLPSIFPFMVLSKFIIAGNLHHLFSKIIGSPFEFLFGINKKYAVVFVLGCIGGYPIGAIAINELLQNGEISTEDAEFLLGFCNNCGPMFIIGTVGTLMLNNTNYGYILYIIHILCVILCGIIMKYIFKPKSKNLTTSLKPVKSNSPLSNSVSNSASAMLNIASYIIIFSVIAKFVIILFDKNSFATLSSLCVLEVTTGIKYASLSSINELVKISLISSTLGFSGLCVFSQSKAVFAGVKISFLKYFISKVIIGLLSFIITAITFTIIFSY